jgi:hypothetical protein
MTVPRSAAIWKPASHQQPGQVRRETQSGGTGRTDQRSGDQEWFASQAVGEPAGREKHRHIPRGEHGQGDTRHARFLMQHFDNEQRHERHPYPEYRSTIGEIR